MREGSWIIHSSILVPKESYVYLLSMPKLVVHSYARSHEFKDRGKASSSFTYPPSQEDTPRTLAPRPPHPLSSVLSSSSKRAHALDSVTPPSQDRRLKKIGLLLFPYYLLLIGLLMFLPLHTLKIWTVLLVLLWRR